eukprot:gene11305-11455_t
MSFGVVILFLFGVWSQPAQAHGNPSRRSCSLGFAPGTTVLFVADPGTFSNTPEAQQYLGNLQYAHKLPAGSSMCPAIHVGRMMRQDVAVALTGIGPMTAALCVSDILNRCGSQIRDVFFSGTAGYSPQLGGVINNGTCEGGKANDNGKIIRLGDVCVSPLSVNWDCRLATFLQTCGASKEGNQCVFPGQTNGPGPTSLFGQCEFYNVTRAEMALADEVLAVAAVKANPLLPRRNSIVQDLEVEYWAAMSNGTGLTYPSISPTVAPHVWSYQHCLEVDSQYFWAGAPWDMVARSYAAQVMNQGLATTSYNQANVLAVSAMEGIGLSMAFQQYNSLSSTRRRIPYTYVRGASDWTHSPLVHRGGGLWLQGAIVENFEQGYKYAISTASTIVMATLQARCEKDAVGRSHHSSSPAGAAPGGPRSRDPRPVKPGYSGPDASHDMPCDFTVNYN